MIQKNSSSYNKGNFNIKNLCNEKILLKCEICGKEIKSVPALTTHLLRRHQMNIGDYIFKFLKNMTPDFKYEKCSFCNNLANPKIFYNFKLNQYYLSYEDGYMCDTDECVNNICLEYFQQPYIEVKHRYEHIGAKADFLARRYKLSIDEVKNKLKHDPNKKFKPEETTSLYGYIARYGEVDGPKKYRERCEKIKNAFTIEAFIKKYGIDEGQRRLAARCEALITNTSNITKSKNQYLIFNQLNKVDSRWEAERYVGGVGVIDMINKNIKIGLEYFGDYWHCNPAVYDSSFFNKSLKCTAKEKQEADLIRLNKMLLNSKSLDCIIIVWEKSFMLNGLDRIMTMINENIQKHQDGKKELIWI